MAQGSRPFTPMLIRMEKALSGLISRYYALGLLLLLFFTIIAGASGWGIYRISQEASTNLLETRAVDIAVNVNFTLERVAPAPDLFQRLLDESKWDDLAFLALMDTNGTVILHSNPRLVGTVLKVEAAALTGPRVAWSRLATGERVFTMDYPLTIHGALARGQEDHGRPLVLRVALHPYPARRIVRKAWFQLINISLALAILWLATLFFLRLLWRQERLQALLQEKEHMARLGEMAAVLAHEIRNPLSTIKGFAQLHMEGSQDPELKEDLSLVVREAGRLEELTENLLIYCRPLSLRIEEFSLGELCSEIEMVAAPRGSKCPVTVRCAEARFRGDRSKLLRIAVNLVTNGCDALAGRPDGRVEVALTVEGDTLRMVVQDNGPGIPEEIRSKLFEPFVTTKAKGSGLGLAICRRLVEAMRGRIEVQKADDGGARFVVEIPEAAHDQEMEDGQE